MDTATETRRLAAAAASLGIAANDLRLVGIAYRIAACGDGGFTVAGLVAEYRSATRSYVGGV